MRENRIEIAPFEMVNLLDYTGVLQANEHGFVDISGVIQKDKKDKYIQAATKETWVEIHTYGEGGQKKTLFDGILTNFRIQEEGSICVLHVHIDTGSKLMDYDKNSRSFQKEGYSYREVADCCNEEYSDIGMIMTEGKSSSIGKFLMQYEETDWNFLKRLASRLNTVLIPSCNTTGIKYFFGVPEKGNEGEIDSECFDLKRERQKRNGKKVTVSTYIVESRDAFSIGGQIVFQGKGLYIWRIESFLKGNELMHRYFLRNKQDFYVQETYYENLIGLSLFGRVEEVDGEKVKVSLDQDQNEQSGNRWFSFSTVYSSPDGAGWYCMPEIGDAVRLYFPTEDESDAHVSSAFHENQGDGLRVDPNCKRWRNKEGKEIRFTPDAILVTNNKGMSVELNDNSGIHIISNKSVRIEAEDEISISSANASLNMAASNKILLTQGATKLELSDDIHLSGGKVHIQ